MKNINYIERVFRLVSIVNWDGTLMDSTHILFLRIQKYNVQSKFGLYTKLALRLAGVYECLSHKESRKK